MLWSVIVFVALAFLNVGLST